MIPAMTEYQVETPNLSNFREQFPEFPEDQFTDAAAESALDIAAEISAVSAKAILYLAAHLLTLAGERTAALDGGSGELTAEEIGPKRAEYKTQAAEGRDVFFSRSAYGRMFLVIERASPAKVMGARVFG